MITLDYLTTSNYLWYVSSVNLVECGIFYVRKIELTEIKCIPFRTNLQIRLPFDNNQYIYIYIGPHINEIQKGECTQHPTPQKIRHITHFDYQHYGLDLPEDFVLKSLI